MTRIVVHTVCAAQQDPDEVTRGVTAVGRAGASNDTGEELLKPMSLRDADLVTSELECEAGSLPDTPKTHSGPPSLTRKVIWNLAVGGAGLGYVLLALCLNIQSPLFAGLFIIAAGYEVIGAHSGRRKP